MFVCRVSICRWKARLWMFLIKFRDDAMFVFLPRGSGRLQRGGRAWKETASAASSTSCLSSTSLFLWVFICLPLTYTSHLIYHRGIKGKRQTTHRKMIVRNSVKGMEVKLNSLSPFWCLLSPECTFSRAVSDCECYQDGRQVNPITL